ncbi:hypothetical protein RUND412_007129 [Rhizina undulata]
MAFESVIAAVFFKIKTDGQWFTFLSVNIMYVDCYFLRRLRRGAAVGNSKSVLNSDGKGKGIAGAEPGPKIDYTVCMDTLPAKDIIITLCNHNYCNECMRRLFKEAITDESLSLRDVAEKKSRLQSQRQFSLPPS